MPLVKYVLCIPESKAMSAEDALLIAVFELIADALEGPSANVPQCQNLFEFIRPYLSDHALSIGNDGLVLVYLSLQGCHGISHAHGSELHPGSGSLSFANSGASAARGEAQLLKMP